jgi:hypothetical protein
MKKLIILCSLLVMVSLATKGQEIPPVQKGDGELKMVIPENKVLLYSQLSGDTMMSNENELIDLILHSKIICCKIDSGDEGKTKTVEVIFSDSTEFSGAYFESNTFENENEILFVTYTEFDSINSYEAIFSNKNKKLIFILSKILELSPLCCEEDRTD